jgi:hypothetical protein
MVEVQPEDCPLLVGAKARLLTPLALVAQLRE